MEHSIDLVSPWRARAFLAAAIAALELLVILVAGIVLVAKPLSRHIRHSAAAKAAPVAHRHAARPAKPQHAMLSRGQTSVLVLNGNGRQGAAGAEAAQIRNLGYPVKGVGNAAHMDYGRTVVMYRPGYAAEAKRLAREAQIRLVSPLDGMGVKALRGARIAIVLGSSS
jgi:LytR cell envelope-related transcriptional attenuator